MAIIEKWINKGNWFSFAGVQWEIIAKELQTSIYIYLIFQYISYIPAYYYALAG